MQRGLFVSWLCTWLSSLHGTGAAGDGGELPGVVCTGLTRGCQSTEKSRGCCQHSELLSSDREVSMCSWS